MNYVFWNFREKSFDEHLENLSKAFGRRKLLKVFEYKLKICKRSKAFKSLKVEEISNNARFQKLLRKALIASLLHLLKWAAPLTFVVIILTQQNKLLSRFDHSESYDVEATAINHRFLWFYLLRDLNL